MTTYQPPGPPAEPIAPTIEILPEGQWVPPDWTPPAGGPAEELGSTAPARARRRWWRGPQSLTGRLVTGAVVLVTLLFTVIGACTYFELRHYLYGRLDQQLQ